MIELAELHFLRIICYESLDPLDNDAIYDIGNEDEPYLQVDNDVVWTSRMKKGDSIDLSDLEPVRIFKPVKILFKERATGHNRDDVILGEWEVRPEMASRERKYVDFHLNNAHYALEYKIS